MKENKLNPYKAEFDQEFKEEFQKIKESRPIVDSERPVPVVQYDQTCRENSGIKNMTKEIIERLQDQDEAFDLKASAQVIIFKRGLINTLKRKTNWAPMELAEEIAEYFDFCLITEKKANLFGLSAWMGCNVQLIHEWMNNPHKYGDLSEICSRARDIMADECVSRGEKYPQFNVFMLKAAYGLQDRQELTVKTETAIKDDEIADIVSKMGLDKPQ